MGHIGDQLRRIGRAFDQHNVGSAIFQSAQQAAGAAGAVVADAKNIDVGRGRADGGRAFFVDFRRTGRARYRFLNGDLSRCSLMRSLQ
jgi:hypothetical protein